MLQASNALNLSLYLLLKADLASKKTADADMDLVEEDDGDDIRTHPVMDRLDQLSRLTDKLKEGVEDKIPRLQDQMNNLVKAAALMEGGELSSSEGSDSSDEEETPSSEPREDDESVDSSAEQQSRDSRIDEDDDENSSDSDEERETQEAIQRRIMTEAKFALRYQDIDHDVKKSAKRKRRIAHTSSDYGDETEELDERTLAASRKLASTMNSIVQKSTASTEKRKKLVGAEDEGADDEYDRLQRGLAMMEEDIGNGSDNDDDDVDGEDNDEGFQSDEDEFYSLIKSKSKAKKVAKKQMYTVAPKYPRLEGEIDGEYDHAFSVSSFVFVLSHSSPTPLILHNCRRACHWQNNIEKSRSRGAQTQDQSQSSCEEARTISQSPHSQEGSRARSSYRRRTCVWR